MQRLVMQQLDEYFGLRKRPKEKHAYLGAVKTEAEIILSLVAYTEHQDEATAENAFNAGKSEVGAGALKFVKREQLTLDNHPIFTVGAPLELQIIPAATPCAHIVDLHPTL